MSHIGHYQYRKIENSKLLDFQSFPIKIPLAGITTAQHGSAEPKLWI